MKTFSKASGLTLIELMVVITIIALISAVIAPQVMKHIGTAKSDTAKMQIDDLGAALDLFYLDNGRYPNAEEGLMALVQAPAGMENWNGPYLKKKKVPKDPWQNEYHYEYPGKNGDYDLYSYGKDDAPGGEKEDRDILSWE